ncbi:sigma-54-dependent transcriptional regulator [Occallatibacter savannae]|uniref:sigma-54-dependent transcriptional regulator n=1 Tax=Occallatibacter savannae TaxID=1002691 RepID=UPI000D69BEE5|nr:sigma-54 dependent transcriptional regulator [Occallatibacter savannae]
MAKILVVDDEQGMRRILDVNLRKDGHLIVEADGAKAALDLIKREDFDVVLTDQRMPDGSGIDVIRAVREDDPTTSVIFLTAIGTVELAVESMRQGAFDFLTKPFDPEVVRASVRRASERTALLRENAVLKTTVRKLEGADEIRGTGTAIAAVRELIMQVAPTSTTVLITGETGTGKELVARAIHRNSSRSAKPFIAINCAAVTETLLESELFGHERGAFTGADRARAGLFEAAHQGTVFLDEVAEMSPAAQAKLLRVLADGEIQRVGSSATRRVDVRVLAATHRDLSQRVSSGAFRQDLYYRLAVVPVRLPALRERKEDIPDICTSLCQRIADEMKIAARPVSPEGLEKLSTYSFPGNIRELRNVLERALILGKSAALEADDLYLPISARERHSADTLISSIVDQVPHQVNLRDLLAQLERALISRSLELSRGVQAEAARKLGLSRSDLGYKLGKHGLPELSENSAISDECSGASTADRM